jgi:hypothetical protein
VVWSNLSQQIAFALECSVHNCPGFTLPKLKLRKAFRPASRASSLRLNFKAVLILTSKLAKRLRAVE